MQCVKIIYDFELPVILALHGIYNWKKTRLSFLSCRILFENHSRAETNLILNWLKWLWCEHCSKAQRKSFTLTNFFTFIYLWKTWDQGIDLLPVSSKKAGNNNKKTNCSSIRIKSETQQKQGLTKLSFFKSAFLHVYNSTK